MEIRDFFTQAEINSMKDRIVRECMLSKFIVTEETVDEDGYVTKHRSIQPEIKQVIKEETDKQIKNYVREIINEVVKDKISIAAENFTKNLCEQLEKITAKTNWYWSIK